MKSSLQSIMLTIIVISVIASGLLASSPVSAQTSPPPTIQVSPGGSDSTGNGTLANPYATISHAVSVAPPTGAVIVVGPGVYMEMVNITKPITLESENSQASSTIINANGMTYGIVVFGPGASGTVIQGVTVENADNHGIYVQDADHVTILNNDVLHNGLNPVTCPEPPAAPTGPCITENKALQLVGSSNSVVSNNLVADNQADGGIGVFDDGQINPGGLTSGTARPAVGNVISGNTVTSNVGGCGVVVAAYNPSGGVTNNLVTGNHVVNGYAGIVVAADTPQTSAINNTVVANTVLNNQLPGIIVHSNTPGDKVVGTLVIRNVLSGNGGFGPEPTGIIVVGEANPVLTTIITGNIVHNEYFGIQVVNGTDTRASENLLDSSVSVPISGASAVSSVMAGSPLATTSTTSMQQSETVDTAMYLGAGGFVLGLVALVVAVTSRRRK